MHYTGTLAADGSKFESSLDRNSWVQRIRIETCI
jgi:FKBP-type peptidyl-prolyl cis-trans isomerase